MSTCRDNQDCNEGTYCDKGLCEWCESEWQHCCTNSTEACYSGWDDKEVEDMCAACVTDRGFETHAEVVRKRVDSMMLQDWLALALASMVVAFAVFAEMRDALLCTNSLRDISKRRKVPRIWRYAIRGLTFARYYIMLPNVILSVVTLVLNDGELSRYILHLIQNSMDWPEIRQTPNPHNPFFDTSLIRRHPFWPILP